MSCRLDKANNQVAAKEEKPGMAAIMAATCFDMKRLKHDKKR
jgi:hypothetical protein